jgi:uncharacterized protein (DUF2235 family)
MKNSLVICCDGTWNSADQVTKDGNPCVTNVLKLAVRTKKIKSDGSLQIVYYDQGVGTGNAADRLLGGAFGDGLVANVIDSYRFLIANYDPGDDIYIFGFSRGAYTARCIAGMVSRCGILKRDSVREYVEAQRIYRTAKTSDAAEAVAFRKKNAIEDDTPIRCIGVWDTVGALGIPLQAFQMLNKKKYEFLDVRLTRAAKFAFQALAVDEHRKPFEPSIWNWDEKVPPEATQTIKQVWFAGAHSDVGGGYAEPGLSDIAFNWMKRSAESAGLEFDEDVVKKLGTNEKFDQDVHDSRSALYKVQPALQRTIGATNYKTEYFHRSLLQRWHARPDYRPEPLKAHEGRIKTLLAGPMTDEIYPVA